MFRRCHRGWAMAWDIRHRLKKFLDRLSCRLSGHRRRCCAWLSRFGKDPKTSALIWDLRQIVCALWLQCRQRCKALLVCVADCTSFCFPIEAFKFVILLLALDRFESPETALWFRCWLAHGAVDHLCFSFWHRLEAQKVWR